MHLLEALRCDPKVAGSIPHKVIDLSLIRTMVLYST